MIRICYHSISFSLSPAWCIYESPLRMWTGYLVKRAGSDGRPPQTSSTFPRSSSFSVRQRGSRRLSFSDALGGAGAAPCGGARITRCAPATWPMGGSEDPVNDSPGTSLDSGLWRHDRWRAWAGVGPLGWPAPGILPALAVSHSRVRRRGCWWGLWHSPSGARD